MIPIIPMRALYDTGNSIDEARFGFSWNRRRTNLSQLFSEDLYLVAI